MLPFRAHLLPPLNMPRHACPPHVQISSSSLKIAFAPCRQKQMHTKGDVLSDHGSFSQVNVSECGIMSFSEEYEPSTRMMSEMSTFRHGTAPVLRKIRYSSESWIQKKVNEHQRKAGKGGPNFILLTSATFTRVDWEGSRLTRALLTSAEADYCDHGLYPSPGRSIGTQFPGSFLLIECFHQEIFRCPPKVAMALKRKEATSLPGPCIYWCSL